MPAIQGLEGTDFETNETIFNRTSAPERLIVIGAGPIGCELAQAFQRLGSDVTMISSGRPLPKDDADQAHVVTEALRRDGVKILEDSSAVGVEANGSAKRVIFKKRNGECGFVDGDTILIATGRMVNTDGLALDAAGVKLTANGIRVSPGLRTSNRRVYAIGDCADTTGHGGLYFTHVGNYHAGLLVRKLLFRLPVREDRAIIPWATYTDPVLAHVGMNEEQARKSFRDIQVLKADFSENDRGNTDRRTEGSVKLIVSRRGRILGADIVGHNADEILNFWSLAVSKKMNVRDVAAMIAPYPTLAETGKRAATSFFLPATRKPVVRRLIRLLQKLG